MKVFVVGSFVASLCLFIVGVSAQEKSSSRSMGLAGPVKKVESCWLVPYEDAGNGTSKRQLAEEFFFNRKGQLTETIRYDASGVSAREVSVYNKNGRRVFVEYYNGFYRKDLSSPWQESDEYVYKYDRAGMITEQSQYLAETKRLMKRITLRYDAPGNVVEISVFESGDTPSERSVHTYDKSNRLIATERFLHQGRSTSRIKSIYNPQGLVTEEIGLTESGRPRSKTSYRYDQKGRLLTKESIDLEKNKELIRSIHKYNDTDRTEEEVEYYGGVAFMKRVRQLDRSGNVVAKLETMTDEAKKVMAEVASRPSDGLVPLEAGAFASLLGMFAREGFKYEYDSRGNWIKRVEYAATEFVVGKDNLDAELKPIRTQIRVIAYFD